MPVEGFPDPSVHKICFDCKKWFRPDEGVLIYVGATSPGALITNTLGPFVHWPGHAGDKRFVCFGCRARRRHRRMVIFGILGGLLAMALLARAFGLL